MLFSNDDEPRLKSWLESRLSKISDAEAPILAEYCIALLKHDTNEAEVRDLCIEQLNDFLKSDTRTFVDDVFQAIHDRTFTSGKSTSAIVHQPRIQDDAEMVDARKKQDVKQHATTMSNLPNGNGAQSSSNPTMPPLPFPAEVMMDPAFMNYMMQQTQAQMKRRKPCFAFQKNGVCHRGATCPYEHTTPTQHNAHEYDPNFSAMGVGRPASTRETKVNNRSATQPDMRMRGSQSDKSKSTLVVDNIPSEHLNENSVRNYFDKFGQITSIDMKTANRNATIKFASWDEAQAAYTSPAPIFDNRFVKVFWLKENAKSGGRSESTRKSGSAPQTSSPTIDLDPVALDVKQKEHEARLGRKKEMEERAAVLAEQSAELQRRQAEQTLLIRQMETNHNQGASEVSMPNESDSHLSLQAQLEALKAKAAAIGVTPEDFPSSRPSHRGRGRGHRGMLRGGRGRGSFTHADRNAATTTPYLNGRPRTLDLRPRTIRISHYPAGPVSDLEAKIRSTCDYEDIRIESDDSLAVTFKSRREAELFSTKRGIGEMSWVKNQNFSASPAVSGTDEASVDYAIQGDVDMTRASDLDSRYDD